MADKKTPSSIISTAPQGGVVRDVMNKLKLIVRLMGDSRVNLLAKIIPIGALAYFVFPGDGDLMLPIIGYIDDAAVLWISSYVFTELCPPAVVNEHMQAIAGLNNASDEIVEAEATDVSEDDETRPS